MFNPLNDGLNNLNVIIQLKITVIICGFIRRVAQTVKISCNYFVATFTQDCLFVYLVFRRLIRLNIVRIV